MISPNTVNDPAILAQLDSLPIASLREIRNKADLLIDSKMSAEKERALDEIKALIAQKGLSGEEVRRYIFPPKYVHPGDPSKCWSGKGKIASWLQNEIDAGNKQEEFLNPLWKEARGDA